MLTPLKTRLVTLLRWSEKYTKTDMVYLAQSNFWLQAGSFFVSIASFLLYILFGHVLSKEVYGTYQYLLSIGALVGAFTMTGMNAAVIRAVSRGYEGSYLDAIRVQLLWNVVPLLGAWGLGTYYLTHGNNTLGWGLFMVGVFIPLNAAFNTYGAYLAAKKDFRRNFYYTIAINTPYYIAVALVAVSLPLALALFAANLITQGIGYFVAHRNTLAVYAPNEEIDPDAIAYGTQLSLINFLTSAIAQIDNILVFHFLGAAELALYSFATAIPDRLNIFRNMATAAFPKFSERTPEEIRISLGRKVLLSMLGALAVALAYDLIAYPFFELFFPNYVGAVPFSQAYAFIIAAAVSPLFTTALTAHRRIKSLYVFNLMTPIVQLALEILGIIFGGLWGLILARIGSALFSSILGWVLVSFSKTSKN